MYDKILNLLHKDDKLSKFYQMLANVIALFFGKIQTFITKVRNNFFFDSLDNDGVEYFEDLLKMEPPANQVEYIDGIEYNVCYVKMTEDEVTKDGVVYPVGLYNSEIIETPLITIDGVDYNEDVIKFEISASIDERRNKIQAKWLSNAHNCIELIQRVIDAWKENEAVADFVDGVIDINFYNTYGVPDDFDTLYELIDDVKPAHLGVRYNFRHLLIEDIHEVKTLEEMENITIDQFMSGVE